jgi:hypothetical protein
MTNTTTVKLLAAGSNIPKNYYGPVRCILHITWFAAKTTAAEYLVYVRRQNGGVNTTTQHRMHCGVGDTANEICFVDSEVGYIVDFDFYVEVEGAPTNGSATGSSNTRSWFSVEFLKPGPLLSQPCLAVMYEGFTAASQIKLDAVINYEGLVDSTQVQAVGAQGQIQRVVNPIEFAQASGVLSKAQLAMGAHEENRVNAIMPAAASFFDVLDGVSRGAKPVLQGAGRMISKYDQWRAGPGARF